MERSEIRERHRSLQIVPGLRFASSGLQGFGPIVMKPVTTAGFI
jgi:hypothetical protein